MTSREPFWAAPRRLRRLLEDGEVTATAFDLLFYVGLCDRDGDGIVTSRDSLADMLGVSTKTISRSLLRLAELDLAVSDLRQGVTTFRLRLGHDARRATSDTTSDPTSDTDPPRSVRSDLGHRGDDSTPEAAPEIESGGFDLGPSRARAETETEKEKELRPLDAIGRSCARSRPWDRGLGRRTLGDLRAACSLVEDLQSGMDENTLRGFVEDELAEHDAADFDYALDRLRWARDRGGFGTPPEPIVSEAAWVRHVLHRMRDGYEWNDPSYGLEWRDR